MRVNTKPRHKNSPRIAEKSAPAFLQWLRGRECYFAQPGGFCVGRIEAMHLDFAGGKGVGTKVCDRYSLPACTAHHHRQHLIGWNTFLAQFGFSKERLLGAAAEYWYRWPGRIAWERKLADNG
jgi:hypothetical protein